MRHKVTCVDCGKVERIEVEHGKMPPKEWHYFGRMNVNALKTDKCFYRFLQDEGGKLQLDKEPVKEPNPQYDPKAKPQYMEYWECAKCFYRGEERASGNNGDKK